MEQIITIDGKEYKIRFDAYFPVFYRNIIESDFFMDESRCGSGDTYAAYNILYASLRYGDSAFEESMQEFFQKLDMASALDAAVEAVKFMRSTYKQSSSSKKK